MPFQQRMDVWKNALTKKNRKQHAQHAQCGSKSGELIYDSYDATSDQDEEKQVRSHAISVCQD